MAKLTESYLRKLIKSVIEENESTLGLSTGGLDGEISAYLDGLAKKSGGIDPVVSISELATMFSTTEEEVINVLNDQEFQYWTKLAVVVDSDGYDAQ
jgi:hypothetical protein